jgi:signal transduction histidine kinase
LYVYGVVAVLVAPLEPYALTPLLNLGPAGSFGLQLAVLGCVPIAFAVAVLLGGFVRTSEIHELGTWLGQAPAAQSSLQDALAQTLGDPSLQLGYWSSADDDFVDALGLPLPGGYGRASVVVDVHGEPIAEINYDPIRNEDPALVRAAGRVVAIAIEQERLSTELRASERALHVAGRRIVEAGDRERNRIAQDLHDGMQAQLVAIALGIQQIATRQDATPDIRATATQLRQAVDSSARQLRELVHDILPAALIERGLGAAVEDLADRITLPIRVDLGDMPGPLSPTTQRTGYFVVAECLTNAAKHAQATKLEVRMRQSGALLFIEVADDGVGGARVGQGLGLRGLTDRIDLLGGRLIVISPPGGGTTVQVELPCES